MPYYSRDVDQIREFVGKAVGYGKKGFYLRDAYLVYLAWADEQDLQHSHLVRKMKFAVLLEELGFERSTRTDQVRFTDGVLLKKPTDEDVKAHIAAFREKEQAERETRAKERLVRLSTPEAQERLKVRRLRLRRRLLEQKVLEEAQKRLDGAKG